MPLSEEQQGAVDAALRGDTNVRVRAVPGAGKTHTCVALAAKLEAAGRPVLQLTYSAALKLDWRARRGEELRGLGVPHTFHSFAYALARALQLDPVTDDKTMRAMLDALDRAPDARLPPRLVADTIIVDEAQDCKPLHARLLAAYARLCGDARFHFVVVGQEMQAVYLHGAGGRPEHPDVRGTLDYLVRDDAFGPLLRTPVWTECPFTQSFRLTPSHAQAISGLFKTTIVGRNRQCPDRRPRQICLDMFRTRRRLVAYLCDLIQLYGPENVIFVAPSWKEQGRAPAKAVRNELARRGYKFCEGRDDAPYQRGKVRCFTFSSCKGLEALAVVVFGADSFCRASREQQFVACTRACEQLVLLQHHNNCPWNVDDARAATAQLARRGVEVETWDPYAPRRNLGVYRRLSHVTDLLRSAGAIGHVLHRCCDHVVVRPASHPLDLPAQLVFETHTEGLLRIQGVYVPFAYAVRAHGVAPDFFEIFDLVVASTADEGRRTLGELRVRMARAGDDFPDLNAFLQEMPDHVPGNNDETRLVKFLRQHLACRGMERYATAVVTRDEYDDIFPLSERAALSALATRPLEQWSARDVAHAALAADARHGEHHSLLQVESYDWVDEVEPHVRACHERLAAFLPADAAFEWPLAFRLPEPWPDPDGELVGLEGRADAVAGDVVYELKLKLTLEEADLVQTFLYLCMHATRVGAARARLLNVRTGEEHLLSLRPGVDPRAALVAALEMHHRQDLDMADVLARLDRM